MPAPQLQVQASKKKRWNVNMTASGVQLGCGLGRGESATHLEAAATASEDRGSPRWCQLSTTHTKVRTYTGCPTNLNNGSNSA